MISQINCRKYAGKISKHNTNSLVSCRAHCIYMKRGCKAETTGLKRHSTLRIQCTLQMTPEFDERAAPDVIEHTASDIGDLRDTLNSTIARRGELISRTIDLYNVASHKGQQVEGIQREYTSRLPEAQDIGNCLSLPTSPVEETSMQAQAPLVSTILEKNKFSIRYDSDSDPFTVTKSEATSLFSIYDSACNPLLPIFPAGFFDSLDLDVMASTNELLFWAIILTGILHSDEPESPTQYRELANKIQRIVMKQCWHNTPRSVHILLALVILTTWPIPSNSSRLSDNYSVKLISLANSLCVQLGLHRLEFIAEFSHKTEMDVSPNAQLNNTIRERIFKLIYVNSNYWHIHLGLSNNNSATVPNYILTEAASAESLNRRDTKLADISINCILKSCMLQTKINESMNDLIGGVHQNKSILLLPDQTSVLRSINLNMFEVILDDAQRDIESASANLDEHTQKLLRITLEYAKLQLLLYALALDSAKNTDRNEYDDTVSKTVACCMNIVLVCGELPIRRMPIYYRFPVELAALILLRIFKSPILKSREEYAKIKEVFNTLYRNVISASGKSDWSHHSYRLTKILHKFDALENTFIATCQKSYALIGRTQNYLACAMSYEMISLIYEHHHRDLKCALKPVPWRMFGRCKDDDVVKFIESNSLILS